MCFERDSAAEGVEQTAAGASAAETTTAACGAGRAVGETTGSAGTERRRTYAAVGPDRNTGRSAAATQTAIGLVGREGESCGACECRAAAVEDTTANAVTGIATQATAAAAGRTPFAAVATL